MSRPTPTQVLLTVSEPTRLRILNCLAAAPLFVSDLQAILRLPQPTVSRHLKVLREAEVVRDTPVAQYVLYRLRRANDAEGRRSAPSWTAWPRTTSIARSASVPPSAPRTTPGSACSSR